MLLLPREYIFWGCKPPWWLLGAENSFMQRKFFLKNFLRYSSSKPVGENSSNSR
jgi:hypothetical protein